MKTLTKTCLHCKNAFAKKLTTSVKDWNAQTKFCSHKCYSENKKKYSICQFCGISFHNPATNPKFCSRDCMGKFQSEKRTQPRRPCKVCGQPVKRARAKYCSVDCRNKGYNGDQVYNYVGENFRKDAYPVDYAAWKKIADQIRIRDKFCQHCGKTPAENGRALDIHHIKPYRKTQNNSHENLIALCRSCHKKADNKLIF